MSLQFNNLGVINTLNGYGIMTEFNMSITRAFLNDIENKDVLEIGPAFGRNTKEILKKCKSYTVIDLDQRHLDYIRNQGHNESKLITICGKFPYINNLNDNSFDAILIERVIHFTIPSEINELINSLYRILKPGGKCYILTSSPDNKLYVAKYTYNIQKWLKIPHPGYINLQLLKYIFDDRWIHKLILKLLEPNLIRRNHQLNMLKNMPDNIYLLTESDLYDLLKQHKFNILSIGREHHPIITDLKFSNTYDTIAIVEK